MIAGDYDIFLDEGATYSQAFQLIDPITGLAKNLIGSTVSAQIRASYGAPTILASFTGVVAGPTGTITLSLTNAQTAGLPSVANGTEPTAVWDLFLTQSDGTVTRVLKGKVYLYPRVTQ